MPRPTNKKDLLEAADSQYKKLIGLIDSMSETDQEKKFSFDRGKEKGAHWQRDENIRDVLIHLYEWHQLLLNWVEANSKGFVTSFLPEPYNWKSYGNLNVEFWKKHQHTSYSAARKLLDESHHKVMKLIEGLSNEALFEKSVLKWTGGSPLGSYAVSCTSSHYDWAMKKIKKHLKTLK